MQNVTFHHDPTQHKRILLNCNVQVGMLHTVTHSQYIPVTFTESKPRNYHQLPSFYPLNLSHMTDVFQFLFSTTNTCHITNHQSKQTTTNRRSFLVSAIRDQRQARGSHRGYYDAAVRGINEITELLLSSAVRIKRRLY